MVAKRIIPALDIAEGRVVKCVRFLNPRDAGDPVDLARLYDAEGADEIVFLDITASHEKRSIMLDVARRVAEEVFIPFTVGGGITTVDQMREILKTGADKIFINSSAVKNPDLISEGADSLGSQCIVVAIDAKLEEDGKYQVYVNGGRTTVVRDAI
jgi:imidazole glycerol-phosphate synthase subunit HisF